MSSMEANTDTHKDLPVACGLDHSALEERRARWVALVRDALLEQEATPRGVRQRYRLEPRVERELRELAELERGCCGFARWTVSEGDGFVELEVSADGEGAAAIREMFRA